MHWVYLVAAILFEVFGTTCVKLSDGFKNPLPSFGMFAFYLAAIVSLTMAVKTLEISVAYAVWSAVGVALIAVIGVFFFDEHLSPTRLFFLAVIVVGVVGLNLSTPHT